jgi:hypothetical protein
VSVLLVLALAAPAHADPRALARDQSAAGCGTAGVLAQMCQVGSTRRFA